MGGRRIWPGAYVMGAAALWSTIGVASVYSGNPVLLALFRSVFASIPSVILYRSVNKGALFTGLALGVLFAVYPLAAVLVGLGAAAFLLYTAPLWTTLIALSFRERPSAKGVVGVVLIITAILIIIMETSRGLLSSIGVVMGLLSGISYGTYIALARYYVRSTNELEVSLGSIPYTLIVTAPTALIYALLLHGFVHVITSGLWGLYMGVMATIIPYRLFSMGISRLRASTASIIATLEPVLASVWGFLLFGQVPTVAEAVAYALIIAASIIVSFE
ncbi:DMT family transporter [Vulcanisaeta thermophila]|uniref:DMT family transporter n=1 Tax=Vulcanisaeta thermophila TaxID=867917 RepID=UPI000853351A|nr:EamA family transporter [Vulcanisaeta thermophila]